MVAGRPVGVRHYPRNKTLRALVPSGIELAPPRREVSTGPGRHDFEIVVDPAATVEEDLRGATSRSTRWRGGSTTATLVDPYGARADLRARGLRTVSPNSFAEDPLRLVRGLRFVSQLGLDPDDHTLAQMREEAARSPRLRRAHRRRARGGRPGGAVEAPARPASGESAAARARHRRAGRAAAGARAVDRLRAGEPLPRPDRRRAHIRRRAGRGGCRHAAARAARGALPRPGQAARRVARHGRAAALLREARLLGEEPRAGQRRARGHGAVTAALSDRVAPARRPHRARAHVRPRQRGRPARAQVARPFR